MYANPHVKDNFTSCAYVKLDDKGERIIGDFMNANWALETQAKLQPGEKIIAVEAYMDGSNVTEHFDVRELVT